MKKNILLTFDYELFLGSRSGTVENCLIRPTEKILNILKENQARAIFFIDTTYLYRLEKLSETNANAERDFNIIKQQLLEIAAAGHYLFHHLHPHWLDARYLEDINQWDLSDTGRYAFASLNESDKDMLFKYSDSFLTDIYAKAHSENKCNGYRAGGLYIEPFDSFKSFFQKYGIKYEFSVVPGEKKTGEKLFYDFTQCPADRPYSFSENPTVESVQGGFIEFPITKIKIIGLTKILNSLYFRITKNRFGQSISGDGVPIKKSFRKSHSKRTVGRYMYMEMAMSAELLNPVLMHLYKDTCQKNQYIHLMSHPKLVSVMNLKCFNDLLKFCTGEFDTEYDITKICDK